jgi:hypothetical protein
VGVKITSAPLTTFTGLTKSYYRALLNGLIKIVSNRMAKMA